MKLYVTFLFNRDKVRNGNFTKREQDGVVRWLHVHQSLWCYLGVLKQGPKLQGQSQIGGRKTHNHIRRPHTPKKGKEELLHELDPK